jgi:hypothetical protein
MTAPRPKWESGVTVNSFIHEDDMKAAYDAAERTLWHSIDCEEIILRGQASWSGDKAHKMVRILACRLAEAVIHSSVRDISEVIPKLDIERPE